MDLAAMREKLRSLAWPPGWSACSTAEEQALAVQLSKEIRPGHALHDRGCVALGKGPGAGQVLYFVPDDEHPLAVVALAWRVPREVGSFAWVESFASAEAWAEAMRSRTAAAGEH